MIHFAMRMLRGLTLGACGLVIDDRGRVLLIEQTYTHGWQLPGGGVERGETAEAALARELVEEAGVRLTGPVRLLSVHSNHANHRGDHVLVYRCEHWEPCDATSRGEIARIGWFPPDALPDGVMPGHRRRIEEAFGARAPDVLW
ncbi:MAG: NUDIX domain-containing protein [Pseudomonadota bacterium]